MGSQTWLDHCRIWLIQVFWVDGTKLLNANAIKGSHEQEQAYVKGGRANTSSAGIWKERGLYFGSDKTRSRADSSVTADVSEVTD